jgi:hypothetical protein
VRQDRSGVRVVEPVLEEGATVAPQQPREDGRPLPGVGAVDVEVGLVGGDCAVLVAATAPVDGQLPLAALVDEVGRMLAHDRGVARAVGANERPVRAPAVAFDDAQHPEGEEAAERAAVDPRAEGGDRAEDDRGDEDQRGELDRGLPALARAPLRMPAPGAAGPSRFTPDEREQGESSADQPGNRDEGLSETKRVAREETGARARGDDAPDGAREQVNAGEHAGRHHQPSSSRKA